MDGKMGGVKPTIPEVLPLVRAYIAQPNNAVSGSLHAVLDDGNTQDGHVQHCIEYARERGDEEGARLAELLLRMSRTQRGKLASLAFK
jgi:hypothetical protein